MRIKSFAQLLRIIIKHDLRRRRTGAPMMKN